jgi:hypothetical protein
MSLLSPIAPQAAPAFTGDAWLDCLSLVPAHVPPAPRRRIRVTAPLAADETLPALDHPPQVRTWREALARQRSLGLSGVDLTRAIILAESQGSLVIHLRQPSPALEVCDFLRRSGLAAPWRVRELFASADADAPCNMWSLSRHLVQRRWLNGIDVGFLHRLGQLGPWRVGTVPRA